MTIETARLILRPFLETDAEDVYEYLKEPSASCFACMKLGSLNEAREEMRKRLPETEYYLAVTLKENGKVIGEICAYPETGEPHADVGAPRDTFSRCWMLNERYQGRGYAFEAAQAFFDYLLAKRVQGASMPIQRTTTCPASTCVKSSACAGRGFSLSSLHS